MKVQVEKTHYDFDKYVDIGRWNSYYYQIAKTMEQSGDDVLVVGAGDAIVVDVLKKFGKNVDTFDFDKALEPDIVGSVTEIDEVVKKKYDVVLCCQVLEHIPFDKFSDTVRRIKTVLKPSGCFILSLPNHSIGFKMDVKIPKMPRIEKVGVIKRPFRKVWDLQKDGKGEHYWEINTKGCEEKKVKRILGEYYSIAERFIPMNNLYHIFYVLKKERCL